MRVFGYGSLIWDGWQSEHNCLSVQRGTLQNHQRIFNKASVKNWGSKLAPGPTLNVVSTPGAVCEGSVFEFAETDVDAVMAALTKREGGFQFPEHGVRLASGEVVMARVPVYTGKNLIAGLSPDEIAAMIAAASGTSGRCRDYVLKLASELRRVGIADAVVEEMARRVEVWGEFDPAAG